MADSAHAQGSPEWRMARLGKVTSSRFADVMTNGRGGGPSQTALSYMFELIGERLTGEPADEIKSKYLEWGNEHEPAARAAYTWHAGHGVAQTGFVQHPDLEWVGGSPDGLVGEEGVVEIKCPYTPREHLKTVLSGEVPRQYLWQVQGNLWVTSRKWEDYVSYHPKMPAELQLCVVRMERDDELIEDLERRVTQFLGQIEAKIEKIYKWASEFHQESDGE